MTPTVAPTIVNIEVHETQGAANSRSEAEAENTPVDW